VLEGRTEILVLHATDLPATLPLGLVAEVVMERRDPRTVAVTASSPPAQLRDLPAGTTVLCPSHREAALLRALHPDLEVHSASGSGFNPASVGSALERVRKGEVGAALLPAWIWERHRVPGLGAEYLERTVWIPRPGEGGTAVVHEISNREAAAAAAPHVHLAVRGEILAELAFLESVDPAPDVVVLSTGLSYGAGLRLWGLLLAHDGSRAVKVHRTGEVEGPEPLGWSLAADTVARGAGVLA
jgi:porphobilinogen deaminase